MNPNKIKAGTTKDLPESMAAAMMESFKTEWAIVMKDTPTPVAPNFTKQSELLFIAIAQGVVNHLVANPKAFNVEVTSGSGTLKGNVTSITTS
jgi:hypothetical protein